METRDVVDHKYTTQRPNFAVEVQFNIEPQKKRSVVGTKFTKLMNRNAVARKLCTLSQKGMPAVEFSITVSNTRIAVTASQH